MDIERNAHNDNAQEIDDVSPFHEAAIQATSAVQEPEKHGPMAFIEAMAHLVPGG